MSEKAPKKRISPNHRKIIKASTNQYTPPKDIEKLLGYANCEKVQLDYVAFKLLPKYTNQQIITIGHGLMQWAVNDESALKLHTYFRERGIDYATVERWRRQCDEFDTLCYMALAEIGDRREKAAYHKLASEQLVLKTMGMYDQDYKSFLEWQAKINKPEDNSGKPQIVVIDRYEQPKEKKGKK
jgi:hypothetical protein